jgi:hypothetical protein
MTLALHGGPLDAAQRAAVTDVLDSGLWGATQGGTAVAELVAAMAARSGVSYGVAVGNATLGLFAALRGLGIGAGDEVVVPAYTFVASATAVLLAGATPVIVDVEDDLHLAAAAVEAAVTPRTAAIMAVHLAGSPADMDALTEAAARHGLAVVEDAAQAHGAAYHGRPVGGLGDAGVFSFQSSKAMTAGEGGLIVCRDDTLHRAIWSVCNLGRTLDGAWYGHQSLVARGTATRAWAGTCGSPRSRPRCCCRGSIAWAARWSGATRSARPSRASWSAPTSRCRSCRSRPGPPATRATCSCSACRRRSTAPSSSPRWPRKGCPSTPATHRSARSPR